MNEERQDSWHSRYLLLTSTTKRWKQFVRVVALARLLTLTTKSERLQVEDTHKLQTFEMQNEVLLTVEKHEEILAIINGSHAAELLNFKSVVIGCQTETHKDNYRTSLIK